MYDYHNQNLDLLPENPPASPAEETIPFFRVIRHTRPNFVNLAEQMGGWESAGMCHATTALSIVTLVRTAAVPYSKCNLVSSQECCLFVCFLFVMQKDICYCLFNKLVKWSDYRLLPPFFPFSFFLFFLLSFFSFTEDNIWLAWGT